MRIGPLRRSGHLATSMSVRRSSTGRQGPIPPVPRVSDDASRFLTQTVHLHEEGNPAWPPRGSGQWPPRRAIQAALQQRQAQRFETKHDRGEEGRAPMEDSRRDIRARAGQRWLQATVEAILAQAAIPLASRAMEQPAMYWETPPGARPTLYLWLAAEGAPRQLPFVRALIEDCCAGVRVRHAYARSYIIRRLKQMGLLVS